MTLPITVVIPCAIEHVDTLQRAIDSALVAGAGKIVVVLDAVPYRGMAKRVSRVVVIDTGVPDIPLGVCAARNLGIARALPNEPVFPLDADDELLPDGLKHLYDAYAPGKLVYGDWLSTTDENGVLTTRMVGAPPPHRLPEKNVSHASWLFNKADWQRVGGYDPTFNIGAEDYEFMVALVSAGIEPVRVTKPIYRKYENPHGRGAKCWDRRALIRELLHEKHPTFFKQPEPA